MMMLLLVLSSLWLLLVLRNCGREVEVLRRRWIRDESVDKLLALDFFDDVLVVVVA